MTSAAKHLAGIMRRRAAGETMGDIMRGDEVLDGHRVVAPGDEAWFPVADWDEDAVVSVVTGLPPEVRIVAIIAKRPGTGAFRRLVTAIAAAGMTPVVCSPFPDMTAILKRWRWVASFETGRLGPELQFRPPKKRTP